MNEGNYSFLLDIYIYKFHPSQLHVHTVYLTLFVSHHAFVLFNGAPDNMPVFFFSFIKFSHNSRETLNEPSLRGKQAWIITHGHTCKSAWHALMDGAIHPVSQCTAGARRRLWVRGNFEAFIFGRKETLA